MMFGIPLNIPNILSLYRLASFPFILVLIWLGYETTFVVLFAINQITDIADGYIARRFNMSTPIGAILDSYADLGSYIIAFYGIICFQPVVFEMPYLVWWLTFVFLYLISYPITYFRYRQWVAGLHLYSSKITGYVQGSFLVFLFIYGMMDWYFYLALGIGILAELEVITINLLSPKPIMNAKGLYWVLKNKAHLPNQTLE